VTFVALWGADRETGPFFASSPDQNILLLQLFVLLTTIPVFCIAAVNAARNAVGYLHRALLVSLHDHVALIDANGLVLEINDSWRRFATSPGITPFGGVQVGDDYLEAVRVAAKHGDVTAARVFGGVTSVLKREILRFEMEYDDDLNGRQAGGRYALRIEALERLEGGAVIMRSDVTSRRQAQLEIEEQRREVSHLARVAALGQLSGALAHELNQPLSSICNNAEAARHLLRRQPTDLDELDMILRDIVSEDQRAAQVIRRLRALLKRGDTRVQLIDPKDLVNEVLELANAELLARNVAATASAAPNVPPLLGDRVQLQQVLLNLVLNACEAMAAAAESDRRLVLGVRTDERGHIQFSLRDQGTGIPPELIDRLFEPFVTTKPDGLGLGLSISRTIVGAHGGRLWAENNADRGATIHCQFAPAGAGTMVERPNGLSMAAHELPALRAVRDVDHDPAEEALTRQVAW
jgi:signal transduction histidine kinase